MAVVKRFTDTPLQVVATPGMRDRIVAVADAEGISNAQVIREILDAGISRRETQCEKKTGRKVRARVATHRTARKAALAKGEES